MRTVQSEVAGEIAALLTPVLTVAASRPAGIPAGGGPPVDRLWSLLSGYPPIGGLARHPDEELEADLTREIGRVLQDNRPLEARVTQLVAEARGARPA